MKDQRIAYGALCCWWDSIDKVGTRDGLPCCPHCRNVLFELPTEGDWWAGVDRYEREKREPGYRKLVEWSRGKCFPGWDIARAAYAEATRAAH